MSALAFFHGRTPRDWVVMSVLIVVAGIFAIGSLRTPENVPAPVPAPPAASRELSPSHLAAMTFTIQARGYACTTAQYGHLRGQSPYGLEFKVTCDTGTFQAIVRPDNDIWVHTWANRLK